MRERYCAPAGTEKNMMYCVLTFVYLANWRLLPYSNNNVVSVVIALLNVHEEAIRKGQYELARKSKKLCKSLMAQYPDYCWDNPITFGEILSNLARPPDDMGREIGYLDEDEEPFLVFYSDDPEQARCAMEYDLAHMVLTD